MGQQWRPRGRDLVWMVQTPQVFDCALIREAYRKLMESDGTLAVTDDAMVLESMEGKKVRLVEGSYRNIKITTPEDLLVAEAFLKRKDKRHFHHCKNFFEKK